ncbi:MAG TPA: SiaB family protein kinase, partial [Bacteroidia bacterium]|nr:SiaB family protein kinase [Bacteroidia bacterium]
MKTQHFPFLVRNFPFLFYYRGDYKIDISSEIFEIVNANLSLNFERSFVSRLSYLVIECIQNVYRYTDSRGSFHDYCLIYSDKNFCHVMTRNLVSGSKADELRSRLEEIKTKTSEEIDEAYKSGLRSKTLTSKGAGLGLIEMARKTGNQLNYEFQKTSGTEWSYSLHIKLPLPVKEEKNFPDETKPDEIIKTFLQEFEHNKNTLLYSGDFSNNFLNCILTLVTQQYKRDKESASSVFKYALIEFVQNVKRHASKSADGTIEA